MNKSNNCCHKISFLSWLVAGYYGYCVCKKCKKKIIVKQEKKIEWPFALLFSAAIMANAIVTFFISKEGTKRTILIGVIIVILIITIIIVCRRFRQFCSKNSGA